MRTTVTLDPDVVAKLKELMRGRDLSFKQALNESLRAGLAAEPAERRTYRVPARRLGLRPGVELDKALSLAADLEDAETVRKLELRK